MKHFTYLFVLGLASLLFQGCGTDTGNPGASPVDTSPATNGDFIGYRVCMKLTECVGSPADTCSNSILNATGMTSALMLNTSTYPLLSDAINGVSMGALRLSQPKLLSCHTAISQLTCANSLVTSSFNSSQPNNFNNAFRMLGASADCQQIVAP